MIAISCGRLSAVFQSQPPSIRLFVELLPVLDELRVGGELVVVADVEAELLFGRRDRLRPGEAAPGEQ